MRLLVLLMALWFAPVSFANEDTEEGWQARPCPSCPGGKCPKKPRPRPTR
jgi:hypothetical protein